MADGKTMNRSRLRDQSHSPLASQRPGAAAAPASFSGNRSDPWVLGSAS
jgi:hypothetical protein